MSDSKSRIGVDEEELQLSAAVALMHDPGKLGHSILNLRMKWIDNGRISLSAITLTLTLGQGRVVEIALRAISATICRAVHVLILVNARGAC